MIRAIRVDDRIIELVPTSIAENPHLNLFSADSMTLVVGPNGSGKTRLLVNIAEAVISGDPVAIESAEPTDDFDVIYLTLSNFGKPAFATRSKRLHVLYRSRASQVLISDDEVVRSLRGFGWKPKFQLKLGAREKDGMRMLVDQLTKESHQRRLNDKDIDALIRELEKLKRGPRQDEMREGGELRWFESETYRHIRDVTRRLEDTVYDRVVTAIASRVNWDASLGNLLRAIATVGKLERKSKALHSFLLVSDVIKTSDAARHVVNRHVDMLIEAGRKFQIIVDILGIEGSYEWGKLDKETYDLTRRQASELGQEYYESVCTVELKGASSGIAALVTQFTLIKKAALESIRRTARGPGKLLLLIDEGDVFLHLAWQQRYVAFLDKFVASLKKTFSAVQVVLTTHSPVLMSDFPRDCIYKLPQQTGSGETGSEDTRDLVSFGAQLADVVRNTGGAGTMGEFALQTIRRWSTRLREGRSIDPYHFDLIDDPVIKRLLLADNESKAS